jgi:restriction endonuclease S subunit
MPLSQIVSRVSERNGEHIDRVLTVSAHHGLVEQESFFTKRVAAKNLTGYLVVRPGTFVYNKSYSAAAPFGVVTYNKSTKPGVVSPLYFTFRPNSDLVLEEYLEYVLNSNTFHQQMARYVKEGGRAHGGINVSVNDYLSVEVPLPTLLEQRRVVDLVSSVDSYIAALQQQADAARVARNAVLSELLSAGRDDWTETTLGDVAEYVNGYPFKPEHLGEVGTPVIRIRQLLDPTEPVDRTSIDVPDKCVLRDGDIVFSWSGTLAVRIWTRGEAFLNQHLFRILPGPKVDKALLPLLIEHAIEDLIEKSHGTTMKHITKQSLLPHEILLPPLQDQRRIVDLVSSIDDVVQSTERAVADAKSLRSGLLSAVLSGDHEIPESYDRLLGAA